MILRIKTAFEKVVDNKKEVTISGYLQPNFPSEDKGVALLVDVFKELDNFGDKIATNGKTILFKSVEGLLLLQQLEYMAKELDFPLKLQATKNFVGSKTALDAVVKEYSRSKNS